MEPEKYVFASAAWQSVELTKNKLTVNGCAPFYGRRPLESIVAGRPAEDLRYGARNGASCHDYRGTILKLSVRADINR